MGEGEGKQVCVQNCICLSTQSRVGGGENVIIFLKVKYIGIKELLQKCIYFTTHKGVTMARWGSEGVASPIYIYLLLFKECTFQHILMRMLSATVLIRLHVYPIDLKFY